MSTNETFAIVGLTGGIASGKSTVSEMIRDHEIRVLDADVIAREIVEPGEPALDEIRAAFGDAVLAEDGSLDRESLGDEIFDDPEARERLEAITHPRIARRMQEKAAAAREAGANLVVYDAALIVENGLHQAFDSLIVVSASESTQLSRVQQRDGLSEKAARSRIDAQMPLDEKLRVADFIVDNDGSLEQTRRQVDRLCAFLREALARHGTTNPARLAEHGMSIQAPCRAADLPLPDANDDD